MPCFSNKKRLINQSSVEETDADEASKLSIEPAESATDQTEEDTDPLSTCKVRFQFDLIPSGCSFLFKYWKGKSTDFYFMVCKIQDDFEI